MGIPRVYNQATEGAVVSYDWNELADGTGYKIFYGLSTDAASGELQGLINSVLYSNSIAVSGSTVAGFSVSGVYTTVFNSPRTAKGNAYVSFGWYNLSNLCYPFCEIYKTEGATDTSLGYISGAMVTDIVNQLPKTTTFKMALPQTHFKKDDILKLKVGIAGVAGGAGTFGNIGQDPMNRDGLAIKPSTDPLGSTTKLTFACPFKPDL